MAVTKVERLEKTLWLKKWRLLFAFAPFDVFEERFLLSNVRLIYMCLYAVCLPFLTSPGGVADCREGPAAASGGDSKKTVACQWAKDRQPCNQDCLFLAGRSTCQNERSLRGRGRTPLESILLFPFA